MGRATTPDSEDLEHVLGHTFRQPELLLQALTHPSYGSSGAEERAPHYQRLEFLGDRVLGLVLAELLFRCFPEEAEGALTRRFAALARRDTLAEVALDLGIGAHIRVGPGEDGGGQPQNPAVLADCCESLIGALYLDGGFAVARAFVDRLWRPRINGIDAPPQDPKTALQEWAQARALPLPDYRVIDVSGDDHRPHFTIEVSVSGNGSARADGASKRAAEKKAARALLDRLKAEGGG